MSWRSARLSRPSMQTIVNAGFVLQIDAPDLAMERHTSFAGNPLKEFLDFVDVGHRCDQRAPLPGCRKRKSVSTYAGVTTRVRIPTTYALDEIVEHLYRAEVSALLLSMANPRHEHDYHSLESHRLPAGMKLIVGAVDSTTNYVEHPEVVADRIERVARAVGDPRRVMAGTDCGFDTSAGFGMVADELVWEKLRALSDGAAIASAPPLWIIESFTMATKSNGGQWIRGKTCMITGATSGIGRASALELGRWAGS